MLISFVKNVPGFVVARKSYVFFAVNGQKTELTVTRPDFPSLIENLEARATFHDRDVNSR